MDVDVDCLLSGNDHELTDRPDFELEDNCQGKHGRKCFKIYSILKMAIVKSVVREQVL